MYFDIYIYIHVCVYIFLSFFKCTNRPTAGLITPSSTHISSLIYDRIISINKIKQGLDGEEEITIEDKKEEESFKAGFSEKFAKK